MDWDSTSYTSTVPHCLPADEPALDLRQPTVNEENHAAGQIWSGALWRMNRPLGRDVANQIILEAQFAFTRGSRCRGPRDQDRDRRGLVPRGPDERAEDSSGVPGARDPLN